MKATTVKGAGRKVQSAVPAPGIPADPSFASADEMRQVLDRLLTVVDADSDAGPRLRAARVPHRFCFPDLDVVLNVTDARGEDHCLEWEFPDRIDWRPSMTLEMDSAVANRYLQGAENLAIALARRRIRFQCSDTRAALAFFPSSAGLVDSYRSLVKSDYPHLALS